MKEFSEKSLEDLIFESASKKYSRENLEKHGLRVEGKLYRQLDLGKFGRLDLVSICIGKKEKDGKRTIYVDVYELKKVDLTVDALLQAVRYLSCICLLFGDDDIKERFNFVWKITLIGSGIDEHSDFCRFLTCLGANIRALTYDIKLDGVFFNDVKCSNDYCDIDILFNQTEKLNFADFRELLNETPTDLPI